MNDSITNETGNDSTSLQAAAWMHRFANLPDESSTLPDPQLLWWKAQALRRIDQERLRSAAFEKIETMQIAGSVAATLVLLVSLIFAVLELRIASTLFLSFVAGGFFITGAVLHRLWSSTPP